VIEWEPRALEPERRDCGNLVDGGLGCEEDARDESNPAMSEMRNLALDVDEGDGARGGAPRARIAVSDAWAFTRHGGAPIVSRDCTSLAALEREVARLQQELADALDEARRRFGAPDAAAKPGRPAPAGATQPAPAERRLPALDASLRVSDVMTREVRTLGPNERLSVADELMKQGRFRHVVIVDEGRVVGVVSRRDIFHGALAWSLGQGRKAYETLLAGSPAKDVMATDVVTVDPGASLAEAARLLREHQIGCLPVVAGDELVGILTEGDFLALLARPA
jgi:acetoin utilization protein AcuB